MQAIVNDILTNYQKSGRGPQLLLLHGWGDSSETFAKLARDLKGFSLIMPDLPGFGQTEMPREAWNLDDYARFTQAFLNKIDSKPKVIIAHSNGGAVAIRGLAQGILKADKLVLLSTAGIRDRQNLRRFSLKLIAKAGKLATFWLPIRYKHALQKRFYGTIGSDLMVVPHMRETFKRTVRQDVQADAKKLDIPVLLIYGKQDRATPPELGAIYNRLISKSELHVIGGAEHFVHQDSPAETAKLIKEFIK